MKSILLVLSIALVQACGRNHQDPSAVKDAGDQNPQGFFVEIEGSQIESGTTPTAFVGASSFQNLFSLPCSTTQAAEDLVTVACGSTSSASGGYSLQGNFTQPAGGDVILNGPGVPAIDIGGGNTGLLLTCRATQPEAGVADPQATVQILCI